MKEGRIYADSRLQIFSPLMFLTFFYGYACGRMLRN